MEQTRGCRYYQNDGFAQNPDRDRIRTGRSPCCSAYQSIQPIQIQTSGQYHSTGQHLLNHHIRHRHHPSLHYCRFHPDQCQHIHLNFQEIGLQCHCTHPHHHPRHDYFRCHHYQCLSIHLDHLENHPCHSTLHLDPYRTCIGLFQLQLEPQQPLPPLFCPLGSF